MTGWKMKYPMSWEGVDYTFFWVDYLRAGEVEVLMGINGVFMILERQGVVIKRYFNA